MKQILLIVNPAAGTKKAGKQLSQIVSAFNRAGYAPRLFVTSKQGDATMAVKTMHHGVEMVVCCGGDGTLNEVVSGMLSADLQIPIGYIPAGSTNDFARSLHLSSDLLTATDQIINGTARPYDIGQFNDRYFSYVASFGAFTKTSYATSQSVKNTFGHLAYVVQGLQEVFNIRKIHLTVKADDEEWEGDYCFGAVCNATSIGGILALDEAIVDMSDGLFELLLVKAPKDVSEITECISALQNKRYDSRMLTFCNAKSITITTEEGMAWSLDGEKAEAPATVTIENLPKRILLVH